MANNYFVVNTASNLIIDVVCTSYSPQGSRIKKFVKASDKALNVYYKWMANNPDALMDIGDLMARSEYTHDQLVNGRSAKVEPKRFNYRAPQVPPLTEDRYATIRDWLRFNPGADEYNLDDAFQTGIVAARAYLAEFSR
ncbi:hypothetical protein ID144_23730 [Pseudomonas sp. JM0905a]|uniref:hypothetical protein n=1 Tax=Pseudomonas sp. JM0905a TaxID=2772484 RepID=UPI00168526A8|nr:hypothetical protein [Pseudomonas sp. JM0905a]MBD2840058.1 hypothetical protein [Pseudomonas sp. JM0905a]